MGASIFAGAIVAVSIAFLLNIAATVGFLTKKGAVGSGTWPGVLLTIILVLGAVNFFAEIRKYAASRLNEEREKGIDMPKRLICNKLFLGVVAFLVYVPLLDQIGFICSTPLFLIVYMTLLGQKSWKTRFTVAILATAVLYLLFVVFLMVPLPRGYGIFREFSLLLESF